MASITDPKNVACKFDADVSKQPDARSPWARRMGQIFDTASNDWQEEMMRILEIITEFSQPGRLLDLACGEGEWTPLLAKRAQVVALDYSNNYLQENRRRWQHKNHSAPLNFVCGDVFRLPFQTDSFDRCFFGFGFNLVPREVVQPFLAELNRVVRTGGRVLFIDTLATRREESRASDNLEIPPAFHYPATLRAAIWPFAEDIEIFRTANFFVVANYVVRAQKSNC